MNIPDSVLSNFAKMANLSNPSSKEYDIYATVVNVAENGKDITVLIDGSDNIRTPCITTVECSVGDRVIVSFKNREAVVTSNLTKKMITVAQLIAQRAEIDTLLAKKATVDELNAATATINSALVKKLEADDLKTNNIEIKGKLIGSTGTFNGNLKVQSGSGNKVKLSVGDYSTDLHYIVNEYTVADSSYGIVRTYIDPGRIEMKRDHYMSASDGPASIDMSPDGVNVSCPNRYTSVYPETISISNALTNAECRIFADNVQVLGMYNGARKAAQFQINNIHDGIGRCVHTTDNTITNFRSCANSGKTLGAYFEVTGSHGTFGIDYGWSSDRDLKEDIEDSDVTAIDIVKQIRHRQFKWKDRDARNELGYIAQEIEEVIPGSTFKPEGGYNQIIDYAIIPYLSKAIQEQQDQIETLEARIKMLEEKLNGKTEDHTVPTEKE